MVNRDVAWHTAIAASLKLDGSHRKAEPYPKKSPITLDGAFAFQTTGGS